MSELISGKEALIALANGDEVEYYKHEWMNVNRLSVRDLTSSDNTYKFRLKPRTITLNGVELSPCVSIGICRIKNEVSIQFKDESDADKLYALLTNLFGFRG